jgi:Leucine-rich repeat (LRR) protein
MVIKAIYLNNTEIKLNNIDEIYDLKNPENVIKIDLSYNKLINLPENIFGSLTNLQNLNLHYNNLSNLPENIFNNLTQLQHFILIT